MPIIDFWTTNLNPITLLSNREYAINSNSERMSVSRDENIFNEKTMSIDSDYCSLKKAENNLNYELIIRELCL